jgi:hypothetical protein
MRNNFRTFCALASLTLLVAICGCTTITEGYVRIVQVSSIAPLLRATVGGEVITAVSAFPSYTKYTPVAPGSALPVNFYNANANPTVILSTTVNVTTNSNTSIYVMNKGTGLQAIVYPETDSSPPAAGDFKLRVVQAASGEPALDVYVTAPGADLTKTKPVATNVTFTTIGKYMSFVAGTYQIRMTPVNTPGTVLIDSGAAQFFEGQILSSIALDGVAPGTFGLMVTDDLPPAI